MESSRSITSSSRSSATASQPSGSTDTSDAPAEDRVVLAVALNSGKLGASFYIANRLEVRMMSEIHEHGRYQTQLNVLLSHLRPSVILVSRNAQDSLMQAIQCYAEMQPEIRVEKVPPQQMQIAEATRHLVCLNLQGLRDIKNYNDLPVSDKMVYLRTLLDFSQETSMRSLGALLQWIASRDPDQADKSNTQLVGSDGSTHAVDHMARVLVVCMGMYTGGALGQLVISYRTLRDLHVFSTERPSPWQRRVVSNRFSAGLDGTFDLNVFQLFERHCSVGRFRLRTLFFAPPNVKEVIEERLQSVAYFSDPENRQFVTLLTRTLRNVKRIDTILFKMCRGETPVNQWKQVLTTCKSLLAVHDLLAGAPHRSKCPALLTALTACHPVFGDLVKTIDNVVDFQAHKLDPGRKCPVREGVNAELDFKRGRLYSAELDSDMRRLARYEMERLPAEVTDGRINYVPCMGFIFRTSRSNERAVRAMQRMQLVATMDDESFFRCDSTAALHKKYGDVFDEVMHLEHAIYRQLQQTVLEYSSQLLTAVDSFCTLDAILALALTGIEYNFVRPQIVNENICAIMNGFHPLLEVLGRTRGTVKANSWISVDPGRISLVTGPNCCGKSTYLRQCALIVFLAHLGSPVPAQRAKIGVLDTIQSAFYADETMRNDASGFAIHCRQIAFITRTVEEARALVIVDEFGKGTQSTEGAGLCVGFLRKMSTASRQPHVLMASHYQRQLYYFLKDNPVIKFLTFARHLSGDSLVQLYSVMPGVTTSSFASIISRDVGLPEEVAASLRNFRKSFSASIVQLQESISSSLQYGTPFVNINANYREELLDFVDIVLEEVKDLLDYTEPTSGHSAQIGQAEFPEEEQEFARSSWTS